MTTFQLQTAIAAADLGSISSAAKLLNISQPNASNSIKLLEDEIGFPIFTRNSSGIGLTEKGVLFLEHARIIVTENERIKDIRAEMETFRLRVGSEHFRLALEPFLRLCEKHRDDSRTDFRYLNVTVLQGIQALLRRDLDIVVAPIMKNQLAGLVRECKQRRISASAICRIPTAVTVRKNHPAALDGRCLNIRQGSEVMKDYPYVAYRNLAEDNSALGYTDSDFVPCREKLYADDTDTRYRILAATNAFSFGLKNSTAVLDRYGLVSFIIPGIEPELFLLTREAEKNLWVESEYAKLLRLELLENFGESYVN